MLPAVFPNGLPDEGLSGLFAIGTIALAAFNAISVCADWYLVLAFLRRGQDWLSGRSPWIKCLGLLAPVLFFLAAIRNVARVFRSYVQHAGEPLGQNYWKVMFLSASVYVALSLLLATFVFLMIGKAQRRS
jgi:hypothetical protein